MRYVLVCSDCIFIFTIVAMLSKSQLLLIPLYVKREFTRDYAELGMMKSYLNVRIAQ
jgi:hypothetical protein